MIHAKFLEDSRGLLESFEISGHENVQRGQEALLCAIVSAVSRAFIRDCQSKGLKIEVKAEQRGELFFKLKEVPLNKKNYQGSVDLFQQTLQDLRAEKPALIKLEIARES